MKELQQLISDRYEAMKSLCRIAEQEQLLVEAWLGDKTDPEKFNAWTSQQRSLADALKSWQQSDEALLLAMEEWL